MAAGVEAGVLLTVMGVELGVGLEALCWTCESLLLWAVFLGLLDVLPIIMATSKSMPIVIYQPCVLVSLCFWGVFADVLPGSSLMPETSLA